MEIAREIEAKLLVPRLAELDAIAARRRLGGCQLLLRRRAQLETTYVDTEELALLAAGACLRVRRDGGRSEATAKWMGQVEGDVHARPELTVELPVSSVDSRGAFELPAGPLHDQLAAIVCGRALAPILVTHIDRRILDVVRASGRGGRVVVAELALDRVRSEGPGRRAAGRKRADYGELELELRDGTVAELVALADLVRREHDLSPTQETKLSRGLDAVYGPGLLARLRAPAVQAAPAPGETVAMALRRSLAAQLERIRTHDPGTRVGEDPEALHQQRVGVRRARAVLRAYGDVLPPRRHAWLKRELRWLGATLGAVRDLDVQLEGCEQLGRALPQGERGAPAAHARQLQTERVRQRQRMLGALDGDRYFQLLLELEAFVGERDARAAEPERVELLAAAGHARAERALSSLRKRGRKATAHPIEATDEELHELRIRARRTRYLLEVLSELTGAPGRRVIEHLVRLQDALGEHQDAVVAVAAIAAHRARLGAAGSAEAQRGLSKLAASERRRAERARLAFTRAFLRFDRQWRDVERMLERLRATQRSERACAANGASS